MNKINLITRNAYPIKVTYTIFVFLVKAMINRIEIGLFYTNLGLRKIRPLLAPLMG